MNRSGWLGRGDINAFFGLMLDNIAVMVILFLSISSTVPVDQQTPGELRFTPTFVLTRMIPGTALGVLFGDLVFTYMAIRLVRRTGRDDVTAMPLGLDTPSTFGVIFVVLLPVLQKGYTLFGDHGKAMDFAWHVGLVVLALSGVFKIACAPLGNWLRRIIPRAGLLGSLAAIALAFIAFFPLLIDGHGIASFPLVGMIALLVVLLTLVAHRELPYRIPGALGAVLIGLAVYQLCLWIGQASGVPLVPGRSKPSPVEGWDPTALTAFYTSSSEWWKTVFSEALAKLPLMLPFALATIVGGIDCTESAAAAGDEYDTSSVLMTEGVASLLAGLLGGVIQTTPYIGHPAYKKMGGRGGYTLATALTIGMAGCFGWFTLLFVGVPQAAMYPILVFVGLEITAQSYLATDRRHYPAIAIAALPALAYLINVMVNGVLAGSAPPPHQLETVQTLRCLANGFIITSVLWATMLAFLHDGRLRAASLTLAIAALCAFFGVIHSPLPSEQINLPWEVMRQVPTEFVDAVKYQTPYHWAGAYLLMSVVLLGLGFREPEPRESK